MARVIEGLLHSLLYRLGKFNVVDDAFRRILIGSVAYMKDQITELVYGVYRLAIFKVWSS